MMSGQHWVTGVITHSESESHMCLVRHTGTLKERFLSEYVAHLPHASAHDSFPVGILFVF